MEANHCLNTKNMISKVESVAQSSRVLKKFQVSSIMKISSSDETFEIEKFTSSKERTNINNATQEHSGSILLIGWLVAHQIFSNNGTCNLN